VALEQFSEGGFHGTSMEQIAESAGVTKPVLYQHFGSKRALYLELLEDVGSQLMEAITKATAEAGGPRQQVEGGFTAYFRYVSERRSAFRVLFGEGTRRDEQFSEAVSRVEESIAGAIAGLIQADIDDAHRAQLAYAIVGMAEGVSRAGLASGSISDPQVLARRMAELAWAGLRGIHRD
jgi:AcrR family transcriptional regulator